MATERLAAIYARVSTEEQATTSGVPSTRTQVDRLRALATALGIPVAPDDSGLIVEEVHSGADLRWTGTLFMGLVERAQRREFTDLLVLNVDRFSRGGIWAFGEQMGYFRDAHVGVHFAEGGIPEPGPTQDLVLANIAWAAAYQRDQSASASARVRTAYAAEGNFVTGNKPPFGWQWVEDPTRLTRKGKAVKVGLVPDPETAPVLLHMYEHLASGGSLNALQDWLHDERIPTPSGGTHWQTSSIKRILSNSTNWGERHASIFRRVDRPEGVRRGKHLKTAKMMIIAPEDEQFHSHAAVITPIPGLTRDLALRVRQRLLDNAAVSQRRRAKASEGELAERGLLHGGAAKCATCGHSLHVKPNSRSHLQWRYYCDHTCTPQDRLPITTIPAHALDGLVWSLAVQAFRDPHYLNRLIEQADETAGPAARARSLERQIGEASRERDILYKHLRRLDPDDPENATMLAGIDRDIRAVEVRLTELRAGLAANEHELAGARERQARLEAFRAFAAGQIDRLDSLSALEKRQVLLALRARAVVAPPNAPVRVAITFDTRYLPGVAAALRPDVHVTPHHWVNFAPDAIWNYSEQTLAPVDALVNTKEMPREPASGIQRSQVCAVCSAM